MEPFIVCPNCKQFYDNDVSKALAKACFEFVEEGLKDKENFCFLHHVLYADALTNQLVLLDGENESEKAKGGELIAKFISVLGDMKSQLELEYHEGMLRQRLLDKLTFVEADGNASIGCFYRKVNSEEGRLKAKEHFEKARDFLKNIHTTEAELTLARMNENISELESELSGKEFHISESLDVNVCQKFYDKCLEMHGQNSYMAIHSGVLLAKALRDERRTIEAERLLCKLIDISRLTLGHDHLSTKEAESFLAIVRERRVIYRFETVSGWFQALRYENEGEFCVVQGPMVVPRNIDEEEQFPLDSAGIIPFVGTPVVCHGLQKATHLNGMIGDVRDIDVKEKEDGSEGFDVNIDRCVVHFEDKSLKPVNVKATNLRVLFDLPNADDA